MYVDYELEPEAEQKPRLRELALRYAELGNHLANYARNEQFCAEQTLQDYVRKNPNIYRGLAARFATLAVPRVLRELHRDPNKRFTDRDHVDLDDRLVSLRTASPDISEQPRMYLHLSVVGGGRILVPFTHCLRDSVDAGEGRRVLLRRETDGWHVYAKMREK